VAFDFCGLVARSDAMRKVFGLIERLSESDATVLVTGESGTGKELVARALHLHSPRASGPFVAVNSAALPAELLESELFGHVKGSFTGAIRDRVGRFEMAAGGTLFLDEVGDVPLPLQVKLLRVLQERVFERVGEGRPRPTDARIVAATNVDLQRAVAEGRFRGDLFYRLRVVPIAIPPLRERREDVEPIASALLARINARRGRELRFHSALPAALSAYDWPGNVRELENAVEYAAAVSSGPMLQLHDLPPEVQNPAAAAAPAATALGPRLEGGPGIDRGERERLQAVLAAHQWRRQDAAQALGLSRSTLWRKMRELGLAG
jgi:DNA-binding NtrC family response regulator